MLADSNFMFFEPEQHHVYPWLFSLALSVHMCYPDILIWPERSIRKSSPHGITRSNRPSERLRPRRVSSSDGTKLMNLKMNDSNTVKYLHAAKSLRRFKSQIESTSVKMKGNRQSASTGIWASEVRSSGLKNCGNACKGRLTHARRLHTFKHSIERHAIIVMQCLSSHRLKIQVDFVSSRVANEIIRKKNRLGSTAHEWEKIPHSARHRTFRS